MVILRNTETQQERDVLLTLLQRSYEVETLHGRCNNVKTMSCSSWEISLVWIRLRHGYREYGTFQEESDTDVGNDNYNYLVVK